MVKHCYRTKKPLLKAFIFRVGNRDVELLRAAADQAEVSQSEFVRLALREKAGRVLAGEQFERDRERAEFR